MSLKSELSATLAMLNEQLAELAAAVAELPPDYPPAVPEAASISLQLAANRAELAARLAEITAAVAARPAGAPVAAQYITLAADSGLPNERVLTAGDGMSRSDAGAGAAVTLAVNSTVARRNAVNLFTARQDIRADGSIAAAGLYVPWQPGDTLSTMYVGGGSGANNQTSLQVLNPGTGNAIAAYSANAAGARLLSGNSIAAVMQTSGTAGVIFVSCSAMAGPAPVTTIIEDLQAPAATVVIGSGVRNVVNITSSTGGYREAARRDTVWRDHTDATRSSQIREWIAEAGAMVEARRLDGADSATQTGLWLRHNGVLKRVEVGAADSAGAGYRELRIAN